MEFKNLQAYTEQLKQDRHPAHKIGQFLLDHSNSPDYLIENLEAFIEVIKSDKKAHSLMFNSFKEKLKCT